MPRFNTLLFWVGFFLFVVFFASNALANPQIFFLGKYIGSIGLIYVGIVGMLMGWGLYGMLNSQKGGDFDDGDDGEGF